MKRFICSMAVLAAFSCWFCRADVITLSVVPTSQTVTVGSNITAALEIQGLGDMTDPSLGTFDLNLGFDPSIVSFGTAAFGDPVLGDQLDPTGSGNTINSVTPGVGTVELFDLSLDDAAMLDSLQPGAFTLATITFSALAPGTSAFDLSINALGDSNGNALSATLANGSVTVTSTSGTSAVPEPSTSVLLVGALFVLGATRRRQLLAKGR